MLHRRGGRGKLVLADEVVILVCVGGALLLDRWLRSLPLGLDVNAVFTASVLLAVWLGSLYVSGAYERQYLRLPHRSVFLTLCAAGIAMLVSAGLFYAIPSLLYIDRLVHFSSGLLITLGLVFNRWLWLVRHRGDPRRKVIGIGDRSLLEPVFEDLRRFPGLADSWQFVRLDGFDATERDVGLARELPPSSVFVTDGQLHSQDAAEALSEAGLRGASVMDVFSFYEVTTGRCALFRLDGHWVYRAAGTPPAEATNVFKRVLDLVVCAAAAPVVVPLLALAAIAIKLDSRGPVIYSQRRIGLRGEVFTLHKLRTMHANAESETGPVWARPDDPRATRVGRILRPLGIDELPQLWNVVRGDMSLVGPRPERPKIVAKMARQVPLYMQRHVVPPGITGWAQLHRGADLTSDDVLEKLRYDLYYAGRASLRLDLLILFRTLQMVFASAKPSSGSPRSMSADD